MGRGRILLRSKVSLSDVLPEELEQREIAWGNNEKVLYFKDPDGVMHSFGVISDSAESSTTTWSSTKIQAEIDAASADQSTHNHDDRYYTESQTDTFLSGKSDTSHLHDDRYYTESEMDAALALKSDGTHLHDDRYYTKTTNDTLLDAKADKVSGGVSGNFVTLDASGNIVDSGLKPSDFETSGVYKSDILDFTETDYVHVTGDETIAGVKTFTALPQVPTVTPTLDAQVTSNKHLEDRLLVLDGGTF